MAGPGDARSGWSGRAAVGMLAAVDIRRRWRSAMAIAIFAGLVGAVVVGTAAGARRTSSSLRRFVRDSRAADIEVQAGTTTPGQVRAFAHSPGVATVALLHAYAVEIGANATLQSAAVTDNVFGTSIDRARIVKGRAANPNAPDEITIGESLASQSHLRVGDEISADSLTPAQLSKLESGGGAEPPAGPKVRWRIVGIDRRPLDLGDLSAAGGVIILTRAFDRLYRDKIAIFSDVLRVRLQNPATDYARVAAAAQRIFGASSAFQIKPAAIENQSGQDVINLLTLALWIFAAIAALAGAVAVGIVIMRDMTRIGSEQNALRAVGMTHADRLAATVPRSAIVSLGAAILAVVGAVAASSLFPIGNGRRAEPSPGVAADWPLLLAGALAVVISVFVLSLAAAWRATRAIPTDARERRHGAVAAVVASGVGLRPTVSTGMRMALEPGRGRAAVPVRSAALGVVLGVLGITAVAVVASGLDHLAATPRLYGWTFDFKAPDDTFVNHCQTGLATDYGLQNVRGVAADAAVCIQAVSVNGRSVTGFGFTDSRGTIAPEIVSGRPPSGPDEVALGATTLDALHKHVGDVVQANGNGRDAVAYRIVGRAVFPRISTDTIQPLADGATFTGEGLARIYNDIDSERYLVGRLQSGVDAAASIKRIDTIPAFVATQQNFTSDSGAAGPVPPPEVDRLHLIHWFPPTLETLLAVLALVAVGHALVVTVHRRRREIGVLKTLGFERGQVRATVAWQATTLAIVGLVIGVPAGLAAGRLAWRQIAGSIGVSPASPLPLPVVAAMIPVALLAVNVLASLPARAAARTRPSVALQAE